jgi:hypothetical protein
MCDVVLLWYVVCVWIWVQRLAHITQHQRPVPVSLCSSSSSSFLLSDVTGLLSVASGTELALPLAARLAELTASS